MNSEIKTFGTLDDGREVKLVTLSAGELTLTVSSLGATLVSLSVPSRLHGVDDVLLGYDGLEGYSANRYYLGTTVGRFANRINGARFSLNGREYGVSANKPDCSLHGGVMGFSKLLWSADTYRDSDAVFARFELFSPDCDQGYPGNLKASVSYGLNAENELLAHYEAVCDAPCPVNLTHHAYFNLAGQGRNIDVLSTRVKLYSSSYVEVDDHFIPTGRLKSVEGTPLDFRTEKPIGQDIAPLAESSLGGYDHCMAADGEFGTLRPFGEFFEPLTGRRMKMSLTQPGVQFYTGNMLPGIAGKGGTVYGRYSGFCVEPEFFPDTPNQPAFPNAVFGPGRDYNEKAVYKFEW